MNGLKYLITITKRELGEEFIEFLKRQNVPEMCGTLCNGTAGQKTLDLLGIEKTEKIMLTSVVPSGLARSILHDYVYKMKIDIPGNGIALTAPLDSVGGASSLKCLIGSKEIDSKEVDEMPEFKYALIISIAEKGSTELVMDAARSVGARGGTVIHAKGTGTEQTARFFGISIAAEKELVYIVTRHEDKAAIMRAIMEKAGAQTPAKTIVFSIPVEDVVGLRSLTDIE